MIVLSGGEEDAGAGTGGSKNARLYRKTYL